MKKIAFLSVILIGIIVLAVCFAGASGVNEASSDVSGALCVIAPQSKMVKSGMVGNTVLFSADDFEKNLNTSNLVSITVTSTPAVTEGTLCLGNTVVTAGQTISRSNLDLLNYESASKEIKTGSFTFKVNSSEYEMTCAILLTDRKNSAPTISMEDEGSLSVSTHQMTMIYGKIGAYDADGDEMRFEVVSYPQNGILDIDLQSGDYTYTPSGSYFGQDSFRYVAIDEYGNYSASQTVALVVQKRKTDVVFADMDSHPAHHAALTMTEKNIMSGTSIGEVVYFMPDKSISRIDFLVMTMNAIGISDVGAVSDTGFDDDAQIPTAMKGYVRRARELGLISGSINADGQLCFEPNRPITRAEAALIVNGIVGGKVPVVKPVFADKSDIPTWASDALYSLNYLGILPAENGNISPYAELTRAQTAHMLCALMDTLS